MMHYPDSDTCHAPTTLLRKHPPFVKNQEINESERAASSSHSDDQGKKVSSTQADGFFHKNCKTFSQIKERRHPVAHFYFYTQSLDFPQLLYNQSVPLVVRIHEILVYNNHNQAVNLYKQI